MFTNTTTIVGNLTADPELRFTNTGDALVRFSIASTPRRRNTQTGEWEDGDTLFLSASLWRDAAENVAESLHKGARVVAVGRLRQHTWQTDERENRHRIEFDVDELGPSLRWARARVTRVARDKPTDDTAGQTRPAVAAEDPWAAPAPAQPVGVGASGSGSDEPPF